MFQGQEFWMSEHQALGSQDIVDETEVTMREVLSKEYCWDQHLWKGGGWSGTEQREKPSCDAGPAMASVNCPRSSGAGKVLLRCPKYGWDGQVIILIAIPFILARATLEGADSWRWSAASTPSSWEWILQLVVHQCPPHRIFSASPLPQYSAPSMGFEDSLSWITRVIRFKFDVILIFHNPWVLLEPALPSSLFGARGLYYWSTGAQFTTHHSRPPVMWGR